MNAPDCARCRYLRFIMIVLASLKVVGFGTRHSNSTAPPSSRFADSPACANVFCL
jgi:hypothetical protein